MVDIFKEQICNYCENTKCEKSEDCESKIIEIKTDGIIVHKCSNYKKDPSKIISIEKPLTITAKRKYVKYREI